jgi:NAD+ synthetase
VLATAALGQDRVTVIGMPSRFSSQGSLDDSMVLAEALGIEWLEISIDPLFSQMQQTLEPWFSGANSSLAEENMQSRLRADLLMSWSNTFGHLLLATSNKSEVSVGYSTLYGDMSGAISPIADLWKTEVYELAKWLNEKGPFPDAIPIQILEKAPSAELRPDQKDTDSLPEYSRLDSILRLYIEELETVEAIVTKTGEPEELVAKVVAMTNAAEYKRWQAPPGLKLQNKSFGSGRRIPLAVSQSFTFQKKS